MTCKTSVVAVCCSSASRVSVMQPRILHRDHRLSREFSNSAISLSEKAALPCDRTYEPRGVIVLASAT